MIEKGKQHNVILLPYAVLFLLILGSVLVDFKIIDILYLFALILFFVKYLRIKHS